MANPGSGACLGIPTRPQLMELLFATEPQNRFLQLPLGFTVVDVWNQLKREVEVPT